MKITFDVNVNVRGINESEVIELLNKIFNQNKNIMAKLSDIQVEYQNLKDAIAAEREQILAKIQELQDTINSGDGGTAEERAALLEDIKVQVQAVKDIIPDAPEPEPEA